MSEKPAKRPPRRTTKVLRRSSMYTPRPKPVKTIKPKVVFSRKDTIKHAAKQASACFFYRCVNRQKLNDLTNHTLFTLVDAFLSFWVLLVPPFKDMFIPVEADEFLLTVTIIIFVFFILEIIILAVAQDQYFMRTYFWLDVVATASLVVDMVPRDDSRSTRELAESANFNQLQSIEAMAQLLGRLGRTVRLLRLFRQLRVIKVLMRGFNNSDEGGGGSSGSERAAEALVERVSDRMSRRVVVIILVSVISIMLLQLPSIDRSREESVRLLGAAARNGTTTVSFKTALSKFVTLRETGSGRILSLSVNNETFKSWDQAPEIQKNELRPNQWEELILKTPDTLMTIVAFDLRPEVKSQAEFDIGIIAAVTCILFFFAVLLSWDSVQLIREPFQKMLRAESLSKALLTVFKVTAHEDDINVVSQTVVEASHKLLRCESVNLYFVDHLTKKISCRHNCTYRPSPKQRTSSWGEAFGNLRSRGKSSSSAKKERVRSVKPFSMFSIDLVDEHYISVYVANHGESVTKTNVQCYNGEPYMCRNVMVTPVLDAAQKVVAVVEAVNKRNGGEFTEEDSESMTAFSEQMSAVISRKAFDALTSSLLSSESSLDDTARSLLKQYSANSHSDDSSKLEKNNEKGYNNNGAEGKKMHGRHDSMSDLARAARDNDDAPLHAMVEKRTLQLQTATGQIGKFLDWNTDLFEVPIDDLQFACVAMMSDMGLLQEFRISRNTMLNFLEVVAGSYTNVPYHNFYHGFNVFQVCFMMLQDTRLKDFLERCDMVGLLIGGICHDIGHKGVNNTFHKLMYRDDPKHPTLALTYNDVSVLENMHTSRAFEISTEPGCNIFEHMQRQEHSDIRRMMIKGILATDMENHMDHVKKLQSKKNFTKDLSDRTFLVEISMHTADLNNPTQPWENSKRWAIAVAQEFVEQVKLEREFGLPVSSHMDIKGELLATNPNLAKLNLSFINYLVKGLVFAFCDFFPEWKPRLEELENNLVMWQKIIDSSAGAASQAVVVVAAKSSEDSE